MSHILTELEKTGEPIIVKDILPLKTNIEILKHLSDVKWKIARDNQNTEDQNQFLNAFANDISHKGWAYEFDHKGSSPLEIYANIVIDIVTKKLNIEKYKFRRVMYNYYNVNQKGVDHQDYLDDDGIAILYNIHTTDGGTVIKEKFYKDVGGEAKVFKCNWIHRGLGPTKYKARSNLNICIGLK